MYNILLVDDQVIETKIVRKIIDSHGLPLIAASATNGEEALELLQESPFDILFTDIKMPGMDGLTLAKHAKMLNPSVQTIVYSAFGEFEYAKEAIDLGVVHYLLKPLDIDEFVRVIDKTIALCDHAAKVRMAFEERGYSEAGLDKGNEAENGMALDSDDRDEQVRKVIRDVRELVEQHYGTPDLDIEYLASRVFLSSSYLGHLFKTHTGHNLGKYIIRVRMEYASKLLVTTNYKVADVGQKVGYANPSYFSYLFKIHFGCTPVQYRESGTSL